MICRTGRSFVLSREWRREGSQSETTGTLPSRNSTSRSAPQTVLPHPGGGGNRQDRDLRVHREVKELLRPRETERDHLLSQDVPRFGEQLSHALMAPVKVLRHAGVLRALSGKDKTESTHVCFPVRRFRRLFQSERFPCPCRCRNSGRHGGGAWARGIADMRMT